MFYSFVSSYIYLWINRKYCFIMWYVLSTVKALSRDQTQYSPIESDEVQIHPYVDRFIGNLKENSQVCHQSCSQGEIYHTALLIKRDKSLRH
jgi:hypothetical protein